ncbi:DUF3962 domain-containing protein [Glycomyces sp. NPDC047369]
MAYKNIRTSAWMPRDDVEPYSAQHHTFTLPAHWQENIKQIAALAGNRDPQYTRVPIRRLNSLIAATAPDLVHLTDDYEKLDEPWLCSERPVPANAMRSLLMAFLKDIARGSDVKNPRLIEALSGLDFGDAYESEWKLESVNLWEADEPSLGGTVRPRPWLHRLLPDVIARPIAALDPYEFHGQKVHFRQVACDNGAELMAYPPLAYEANKKTWYYSPFIHISLHTVPFSAKPRVNLHLGMRRWVRWLPPASGAGKPLYLPRSEGAGVYLRLAKPWANLEAPRRLAKAMIELDREYQPRWRTGGSGDMLASLNREFGEFPDLGDLLRDSHRYISNADTGVWAAIDHRTVYGAHRVETGFSPTERMRVLEWAGQALAPHFQQVPLLERAGGRAPSPEIPNPLKRRTRPEEPEEARTEESEQWAEYDADLKRWKDSEKVDQARSEGWRALLKRSLRGEPLRIDMLYQPGDPAVREAFAAAVRTQLRAAPPAVTREGSQGRFEYRITAGDVEVVLTAHPIAEFDGPLLADERTPKQGSEHDRTEQERAEALKAYIAELGLTGEAIVIELPGADGFADDKGRTEPLRDPKRALRKGVALAGKVSQFIRPAAATTGKDADANADLPERAESAWEDCLRSIGIRFLPKAAAGGLDAEDMNLLSIWVVKVNSTRRNRHGLYEPVAVLHAPGEPRVLARTSRTSGWVPYPEALREITLAAEDRKPDRNQPARHERLARFLRTTLMSAKVRSHPTLLLVSANNSRSADRWDWLQDAKIEPDRLQIGGGAVQKLGVFGRNLRIVRVRKRGERDEVPQWWAPGDEDRPWKDREAGESKGLWHMPGDSDRIYYSTAEKNPNLNSHNTRLSKITPRAKGGGGIQSPEPHKAFPSPELVEFAVVAIQEGDDPQEWAGLAHQLRLVPEFRHGLAWPLPLKLAEDMTEYAYPAAVEEADADIEPVEPEDLTRT